jgi:hypothetical protein
MGAARIIAMSGHVQLQGSLRRCGAISIPDVRRQVRQALSAISFWRNAVSYRSWRRSWTELAIGRTGSALRAPRWCIIAPAGHASRRKASVLAGARCPCRRQGRRPVAGDSAGLLDSRRAASRRRWPRGPRTSTRSNRARSGAMSIAQGHLWRDLRINGLLADLA